MKDDSTGEFRATQRKIVKTVPSNYNSDDYIAENKKGCAKLFILVTKVFKRIIWASGECPRGRPKQRWKD